MLAGQYTFACHAEGFNDTICPSVTGTVTTTNICTDPITNLTISSHVNGQVVSNSPITLTGTVQGGVDHITVMVGTNMYTATIVNGVWSVTAIPLLVGINNIWVKAYPIDTDCSPVQKDIVIKYQPNLVTTCTETQLQPTNVQLNG